jgi:hypothetical protein
MGRYVAMAIVVRRAKAGALDPMGMGDVVQMAVLVTTETAATQLNVSIATFTFSHILVNPIATQVNARNVMH